MKGVWQLRNWFKFNKINKIDISFGIVAYLVGICKLQNTWVSALSMLLYALVLFIRLRWGQEFNGRDKVFCFLVIVVLFSFAVYDIFHLIGSAKGTRLLTIIGIHI